MEHFDLDAFMRDLHSQSLPVSIMAMIHHLWQNHPLKIEPVVTLIAFSEKLVIDVQDIQFFRVEDDGDYQIRFKTNAKVLYVSPDTPEFEALTRFIKLLQASTPEH